MCPLNHCKSSHQELRRERSTNQAQFPPIKIMILVRQSAQFIVTTPWGSHSRGLSIVLISSLQYHSTEMYRLATLRLSLVPRHPCMDGAKKRGRKAPHFLAPPIQERSGNQLPQAKRSCIASACTSTCL